MDGPEGNLERDWDNDGVALLFEVGPTGTGLDGRMEDMTWIF